jgi:phosphopantothenoylcysteine decarboxylase/phosphopantothenate--cysteine ligase
MADTPSILYGKKVLLGVTASIAAYKAALIIRLLKKAGAEVRVIMTPDAENFITPLTLATLAKNPVHSDFTEDKHNGEWVNHVELGLWADIFLVAPATSNTLAKMAGGQCDNLLMAVYLSMRKQTVVAPAMDLDMFTNAATQESLSTLKERGIMIIEPEVGELASGLEGKGRMAEPEHLIEAIEQHFLSTAPLSGCRALVTAGPTHEPIDAVRFIGNHSSGKMGIALAEELANRGAQVTLVCGPSQVPCSHPLVTRVDVQTADEMLEACLKVYTESQVTVMAAAVADYRPKQKVSHKIKKSETPLNIELEPTTDILKTLGDRKGDKQVLVGFALETDNEEENARKKLERKNLDLIILNSLRDPGAGFQHDTNLVTMIDRNNNLAKFELKSKTDVAVDIVEKIVILCK